MGLRPEDVEDRNSANPAVPAAGFKATVELIEAMGADTYLYLHTGSHPLVARSRSQIRVEPRQVVEMVAHMAKAHFFEAVDRSPFQAPSGEIDLEAWHAACRLIV